MNPDVRILRIGRLTAKRFFFGLTVLLLLISSACNLPAITPAPAPTPTQSPETATPVAKALPAAVVETDPLPNSDLAADGVLTVYFNQPMQRATVEGALRTQPTLSGKFEWPDDSTVRFTPDQPLSADTTVTLTIAESARAANGLPMSEAVSFEFQTSPELMATERLPRPESIAVDPTSAIVASFNLPVAALGESSSEPVAFSIEPSVEGSGEWINTSTYIFYPEPALQGGVTYTVTLDAGLMSQSGSPFSSDASLSWSFSTALPRLVTVEPASNSRIGLDEPIKLTFNQPVDRQSIEAALQFTPEGGSPISGSFTWSDNSTSVIYQPDQLLERGTLFTLQLSDAAVGLGGTPLDTTAQTRYLSVPAFAVAKTTPQQDEKMETYAGYGNLTITFSAPLADSQDYQELVKLDPAAGDISYYAYDNELYIYGFFTPSSEYTLTLSAELKDRWGMALAEDYVLNFNTKDSQPVLSIPMAQSTGSRVLFMTPDDTILAANATNLLSLDIRSGQMSVEDFLNATIIDINPPMETRWQQILNLEANRNQTIGIELTPDGQSLAPGLYAFSVDSPQLIGETTQIPFFIVSSRIQMTLKESLNELLIWAVDLENNQPVSGLEVRVMDQNLSEIGNATTDKDGLATIPLSPDRRLYEYLFAVSGEPGDADFSLSITNWSSGINSWEYGLPTSMQEKKAGIYLYTDRAIYRPGQTVYLRGIVRTPINGRYELPAAGEYSVVLKSPYDELSGTIQTLEEQSQTLTAFGTFSMAFTLSENASPGSYYFEVLDGDAYLYFQVASYRKPEIEVKVSFDQDEALAGSNLNAVIEANYYFGAPAANQTVSWTLGNKLSGFYLPGGYQFGPVDTRWLNLDDYYDGYYNNQVFLSGSASMDASGRLALTFTPDQLAGLDANELHTLTLEATLTDSSNLPVSGRGSLRLLPAEFAIGIRPEVWSSQAGDELGFNILTAGWDQQPQGNIALSADFQKITWVQTYSAEAGGYTSSPEFTSVGSVDFTTGANGEARIAFTPQDPGIYQVEASSGSAVSQVWVWVSGAGSAPWPRLANQRLRLSTDSQTYVPGQSAHLFIPNPFQNSAIALISVERQEVLYIEVVELAGSGLDYVLPILEDYAPNVYISVTILGRDGKRLDFRQGFTQISVDPAALILNVTLTAEPTRAHPGDELALTLEVHDAGRNPVQGEFSLALIDKAVLALADDNSKSILEAYYGDQPLGVFTSLSLAAYGQRSITLPPGRGGGGGDGMEAAPSLREEFRDTAYWSGEVVTDASGRAQISLSLPDNVTTWVGMVRGITKDSLVGETELEIVATRDVLVRPVTPRFLVAGDHLELATVVHNNTAQDLSLEVSLQSTGFSLDDPAQSVQTVQVKAGGQQRVAWWGTVESVAEADLVFGARGGGLEDFARPTWGKLPVLTFTAPQTFGTAGMLSEAGQRVEIVSLPRSFTVLSGELRVELSPSLAATVLSDLTVIEENRFDFTEALISRIVPNLETYQALKDLGIGNPELEKQLSQQITTELPKLTARQLNDGGWGWAANSTWSDPQISIYAVWALVRADAAGFEINETAFTNGLQYLRASLFTPQMSSEDYQLDRLAFQHFVLAEAGQTAQEPQALLPFRSRLNPWAKALLALALEKLDPGNTDTTTLLSDLQATAMRTASGVNWQDAIEYRQNFVSRNLSTAIVTYALARLDPASALLVDATRYLVTNRKEIGGWSTSYESAWVITALVETMQATGDLQANYSFDAALNGTPVASGAASGVTTLTPVSTRIPLSQLYPLDPNELVISRDAGSGRLYYRAYLQVDRPALDAKPISRGMTLERRYYQVDASCLLPDCPEITTARLDANAILWVRLTLIVPTDQYYAVVEDWLPAGTEVLDLSLKTSQQNQTDQVAEQYNPRNPFSQGWGWWHFGNPQIGDESVTWVAPYLPAGTYELTYQLVPTTAGEFQVLPAHAFIYYFPETEATSAGDLLTIKP